MPTETSKQDESPNLDTKPETISQENRTGNSISLTNKSIRPQRVKKVPSKLQNNETPLVSNKMKNLQENTKLATELYCTCRKTWCEDDGDNMTYCESCSTWLHYSCAGVIKEVVKKVDKFVCMTCSMKLLMESEKLTVEAKENAKKVLDLQTQLDNQSSKSLSQNKEKPASKPNKEAKEVERLNKEINELREQHTKELDLKQHSLESLSSQNKKLKRENDRYHEKEEIWKSNSEELEKKVKTLNDENAAHLEFVKTSLQNADFMEEFESLKKMNGELNETLNKKEAQIIELAKEETGNDCKKKLTEKKKENEALLARIRAFETTVNDIQQINSVLQHDVQVKTANYERELELNNILMKKINQSSGANLVRPPNTDQTQTQTEDHIGQDNPTDRELHITPNQSNRTNKKADRGPCFNEFSLPNSCKFKEKCMFSHKISEEQRNDSDLKTKMELLLKQSKEKSDARKMKTKICAYEYFEQGSCPFASKGKGCLFSHIITEETRNNQTMINNMQNIRAKLNIQQGNAQAQTYQQLPTYPVMSAHQHGALINNIQKDSTQEQHKHLPYPVKSANPYYNLKVVEQQYESNPTPVNLSSTSSPSEMSESVATFQNGNHLVNHFLWDRRRMSHNKNLLTEQNNLPHQSPVSHSLLTSHGLYPHLPHHQNQNYFPQMIQVQT